MKRLGSYANGDSCAHCYLSLYTLTRLGSRRFTGLPISTRYGRNGRHCYSRLLEMAKSGDKPLPFVDNRILFHDFSNLANLYRRLSLSDG